MEHAQKSPLSRVCDPSRSLFGERTSQTRFGLVVHPVPTEQVPELRYIQRTLIWFSVLC